MEEVCILFASPQSYKNKNETDNAFCTAAVERKLVGRITSVSGQYVKCCDCILDLPSMRTGE